MAVDNIAATIFAALVIYFFFGSSTAVIGAGLLLAAIHVIIKLRSSRTEMPEK